MSEARKFAFRVIPARLSGTSRKIQAWLLENFRKNAKTQKTLKKGAEAP